MSGRWELVPTIVLRSTGFPWGTVTQLAYGTARSARTAVLHLERQAAALRAERPALGSLTRGQKARLRNLRPLPDGATSAPEWAARWNDVTGRLAEARQRYEDAVTVDAERVSSALASLREDERFLEAVACSSPMAYRDFRRGGGGGRVRRQLAAYAQRLATKCETMSFFGPINYARVDPHQGVSARLDIGDLARCPARQAFPAARVEHELQQRLLADPDVVVHLAPRTKTVSAPPRRAAHPLLADLFESCDGKATVKDLADRLGADAGDLVGALRTGVEAGCLAHDLTPPSTTPDTVGWLRARLASSPAQAASGIAAWVDALSALLARYPASSADDKLLLQRDIAEHVGTAAADGNADGSRSRFYNDRVIVHEAARGSVDLVVGDGLAHDLSERVGRALDLLAVDAQLTRDATNRALATRLGVGTFPFPTALRRAADLPIVQGKWFAEQLEAAIARQGDLRGEVEVEEPVAAEPTGLPVLASIDVFVAVERLSDYAPGSTPLVVGDVHDAALLTPWALQSHPNRDQALGERDDAIRTALAGRLGLTPIARRTTGLPPLEFPGLVLELGGTADVTDDRKVTIDSLQVVSDGQRATLRSAAVDQPLYLHNGELDSGFHTALALPRLRRPSLPDRDALPRVRCGNVVLSRRRWAVPTADLSEPLAIASEPARLLAVGRYLDERGLPDRFFAKSPSERKPLFVDSAAPTLLEGLARLARDADRLVLSEVFPDEDHTWLRGAHGRYPAELRCVYVRRGATP